MMEVTATQGGHLTPGTSKGGSKAGRGGPAAQEGMVAWELQLFLGQHWISLPTASARNFYLGECLPCDTANRS